jgi:uncharacterized protein YjbJ (UPF0337 family)
MKGIMMDTTFLKTNWQKIKSDVRKKWTKLTELDLESIKGDMEKLNERLQARYSYTRKSAEKRIEDFSEQCMKKCRSKTEDKAA